MADPIPLDDLIARLVELGRLHGVERTKAARELTEVARATVAFQGDKGIWEATRGLTYEEVRQLLGQNTKGSVRQAVTSYRKNAPKGDPA
jgi:hypothetical protein